MTSCTFFGHKNAPFSIEEKLSAAIESLITESGVRNFYIGNHGNFDSMALHCIKRLKTYYQTIDYSIVLAYIPSTNFAQSTKDKIDTLIPDGLENIPPRFAILYRNRWMIDHSDYVITHVTHSFGGAAKHKHIAEHLEKTVINII
ncbi:MAG: hypothetical protein IJC56_01460 [Clostridia bacterium]|nr:hypothetical protein [Clostridia bacterium]